MKNRVALVTGGSRGIGAATAVRLARAGADVVVTYREGKEAAESVVRRIEEHGARGLALRAGGSFRVQGIGLFTQSGSNYLVFLAFLDHMRLVMLVVALVLVAGCSAGGVGSDGASGSAEAPQGEVTAPQGEISVADPGKTLAQATFDGPKGKFDLAVVSLTAQGRLANLTLTLTPDYPGKTSALAFIYFGGQAPEVSLVDPVGLKRYLVVKDSEGKALGSGNENYNIGQPNTLSYTFAAPPENVTAIDVQFDDYPPFRNVPVSR